MSSKGGASPNAAELRSINQRGLAPQEQHRDDITKNPRSAAVRLNRRSK